MLPRQTVCQFPGRPLTRTFTAADLLPYFRGRYDSTTNAAQFRVVSGGGGWRFMVRGSRVVLRGRGPNASAYQPFTVRIDGGLWTAPGESPPQSQYVPIITGASDRWHLVEISRNASYSGNNSSSVPTSGPALEVTGTNPQIAPDPNWGPVRYCEEGAAGTENLIPVAPTVGDIYIPDAGVSPVPTFQNTASKGTDSFRFRATVDKDRPIWACLGGQSATFGATVLEVDGTGYQNRLFLEGLTSPYVSQSNNTSVWVQVGTGDGQPHEYTLVLSRNVRCDGVALGGAGSSFGSAALSASKYVLALGDSLTNGVACEADGTQAHSWIYKAAKLVQAETGTVVNVANRGVDGRTTAGVLSNLPADIAGMKKSPDLVVLWIGTNGGVDVTEYTNTLNAIFTAFPSVKVQCISLHSRSGAGFATNNANIQAAVAACSSPGSCTYYDCTAEVYASCDGGGTGLHPNDTGHTYIAGLRYPAVRAALGL